MGVSQSKHKQAKTALDSALNTVATLEQQLKTQTEELDKLKKELAQSNSKIQEILARATEQENVIQQKIIIAEQSIENREKELTQKETALDNKAKELAKKEVEFDASCVEKNKYYADKDAKYAELAKQLLAEPVKQPATPALAKKSATDGLGLFDQSKQTDPVLGIETPKEEHQSYLEQSQRP